MKLNWHHPERYGLGQPVYAIWQMDLGNCNAKRLGTSFEWQPVKELIWERLWLTVGISFVAHGRLALPFRLGYTQRPTLQFGLYSDFI